MSEKKIVLKSSDGKTFEVEEAVALQSQTITHMVEDSCVGNEIPLENVTSQILVKVIEYCKKHVVVDGDGDDSSEELKNWDTEFAKSMDDSTLLNLTLAAYHLNIESLRTLTCKTVAHVIETRTIDEIRTFLKIENDLTPEEEAEIRKENSWAFDD
ncbi:hypothetical protein EUTSA_v10012272mg [Eutrema salsugineum]|uniref:SKP1-like protein n=1 Tax=Eutrema salsugineum TaxID=72664 RepID=V4KL24_EUTSA|nr:SKP1-like protein 13 [Eutrema salsugineum]ESQ30627.1 hypothetical protein EUTSA_v10012272mg [Eutrema salsugineum]